MEKEITKESKVVEVNSEYIANRLQETKEIISEIHDEVRGRGDNFYQQLNSIITLLGWILFALIVIIFGLFKYIFY